MDVVRVGRRVRVAPPEHELLDEFDGLRRGVLGLQQLAKHPAPLRDARVMPHAADRPQQALLG